MGLHTPGSVAALSDELATSGTLSVCSHVEAMDSMLSSGRDVSSTLHPPHSLRTEI
jgi:hypothetical protein